MRRVVGRHRHVANVRVDGIAVVLGPLLSDARITAATLVDVDSGMVLDAWCADVPAAATPDLELVGAQHAEVLRCALALLRSWPHPDDPDDDACEVVLGADGGRRHLVRTVPDPHGDRLALAVVIDGPARVLDRVRKRLRSVAIDALTAGPSMSRRPVLGTWSFATPGPDVPAASAAGAEPEPRAHRRPPVNPGPSPRTAHPPLVSVGPPAPPVAAPPRVTRLDGSVAVPVVPVRPARTDPPNGRPRTSPPDPPPGTASPGRAPGPRRPAAPAPRPPSPPAALPAPAPPRPRQP